MSRQVQLSEIAAKCKGLSDDDVRIVFLAAWEESAFADEDDKHTELVDGENVYPITDRFVGHLRDVYGFLGDLPPMVRPMVVWVTLRELFVMLEDPEDKAEREAWHAQWAARKAEMEAAND
jgi:hypothetical protein